MQMNLSEIQILANVVTQSEKAKTLQPLNDRARPER